MIAVSRTRTPAPSRGAKPGERRGGRQKGSLNKATAEIKVVAREYGPDCIAKLAALAGLVEGATPAQSEQARVSAIKEILDRAYGKAPQAIVGADGEGPAKLILEVVWAGTSASNES